MTKSQKYLEALKKHGDWIIVSEWAQKVADIYPEILLEADKQASNQAKKSTGLREIAARISSRLSTGRFSEVEIDETERPRKVKFITESGKKDRVELELELDIEPLSRAERIKYYTEKLSEVEKYRIEEIETISKQLNRFFRIDFEVDHAFALLNKEKPGEHHPDNLQLLVKAHNGKKNNKNWVRFTIDEQIGYIKHVIALQKLIASRLESNFDDSLLNSLFERLKRIY